jgi:hypothetical protein
MTQVTGACRFFEGDPGPRLPYRPRNRTGSPSPEPVGRGAYDARSGIDLSLRPLAWLGRAIKIAVLPPKELTPGEPIVRSRPAARVTTQPVCARARGPGVARSLAGAFR